MRVTLTRTGGIMPITKKAEIDVNWSESEIKKLIAHIKAEDKPGLMRDSTSYELSYNDENFSIELNNIPETYKKTFEDLKDKLAIVKRS